MATVSSPAEIDVGSAPGRRLPNLCATQQSAQRLTADVLAESRGDPGSANSGPKQTSVTIKEKGTCDELGCNWRYW